MTIKRTKPLPRPTTPILRGPMKPRTTRVKRVNRQRRASEFARCYGSKARVAWVKSLPCIVAVCGVTPSENAHTVTGGMGRKADADTIAPLCHSHHRFLHQRGVETFRRSFPLRHGWTLRDWAVEVERLWGAYA